MPHTPTQKASFTPGPWTVEPFRTPEQDDDPMMVYHVIAGDLQERFDNLRTDENDEYNPEEVTAIHAENEANAQLLAAAPEMLAVLKFTQKELIETRGNVTGLWARMREVERQIDSIITKAEHP